MHLTSNSPPNGPTQCPPNVLSRHSICASEREASGLRYSPMSPIDGLRIVQFGTPVGKRVAFWTSSSPGRIIVCVLRAFVNSTWRIDSIKCALYVRAGQWSKDAFTSDQVSQKFPTRFGVRVRREHWPH